MSTRSVIARPWGDGFEGRYHHWDGYPSGLGSELWSLYHSRYAEDVDAMIAELVDSAPAGWSSIVGADWDGPADPGQDYTCTVCGVPGPQHYRQSLFADDDPRRHPGPGESYLYANHNPQRPQIRYRPTRSEGDEWMIRSTEDDCGTEWAYVLTPAGLLVCERRWADDGGHMVGMFGMGGGTDGATWLPLGLYPWDGPEPNWAVLEGSESVDV